MFSTEAFLETTDEESLRAEQLIDDRKLEINSLECLKHYEDMSWLYQNTMVEGFHHCFAWSQYDSQTMKLTPRRVRSKKEVFENNMILNQKQYVLSERKKCAMASLTKRYIENDFYVDGQL